MKIYTKEHIRNIRLGHATNSSSSHSIVIMNQGFTAPPTNKSDSNFGWDNFILSDRDAKNRYIVIDRSGGSWDEGGYIDHESVGTTHGYSHEFLMADRVVILGGNDNNDAFMIPNATKLPGAPSVHRKDKGADIFYWRNNGFKIRFSDQPYLKSTYPELVDVKITDYCPFSCHFCYMGSTKNGKHAPLDLIKKTADKLAQMQVFEVALGGGEPVSHPLFPEIIEYFHNVGITPNVTCFGADWLKKPDTVRAMRHVGGLGVSYHTGKDMSKVEKITKALHEARIYCSVTPQHVIGTADIHDVVNPPNAKLSSLLLLGYKNVGRGADNPPEYKINGVNILGAILPLLKPIDADQDDWYFGGHLNLSVDTAFLRAIS